MVMDTVIKQLSSKNNILNPRMHQQLILSVRCYSLNAQTSTQRCRLTRASIQERARLQPLQHIYIHNF